MRLAFHHLLRPHCPQNTPLHLNFHVPHRTLTTNPHPLHPAPLPRRPTIPESTLHESFLKGSGPGGQKINKTSCAVQLTHLPTGLQVKCQATRSRTQNRKIARQILAERVEEAEQGSGSRAGILREREKKKRASGVKKRRRKYRGVGEEGEGAEEVEGEEELGDNFEEDDGEDVAEESGDRTRERDEGGEVAAVGTAEQQPIRQDKVQALFEEAQRTLQDAKKSKGR